MLLWLCHFHMRRNSTEARAARKGPSCTSSYTYIILTGKNRLRVGSYYSQNKDLMEIANIPLFKINAFNRKVRFFIGRVFKYQKMIFPFKRDVCRDRNSFTASYKFLFQLTRTYEREKEDEYTDRNSER